MSHAQRGTDPDPRGVGAEPRAGHREHEDVETYDLVRSACADLTAPNHRIAAHAVARLRGALDADGATADLVVNLQGDRDARATSR